MNAAIGTSFVARPLDVRTVFLSDVHLGTRGARCDFLADFLRSVRCERMFLVGDIVDGWKLRKSWHWDHAHDEVLRLVLDHASRGVEVVYLPGNHDEMFRRWIGLDLAIGGIRLRDQAEHVSATGERILVMHGDAFDSVVRYAKALAILGDWAYRLALEINVWFNVVRRRLGYPYWSLSAWAKRQVKGAVKAIDRFESALAGEARARGFDAVVCGHIHSAEIRMVDGVRYMNCGDWVESCTALVEHRDGRFELLDWASVRGGEGGSPWSRRDGASSGSRSDAGPLPRGGGVPLRSAGAASREPPADVVV